MIEARKTAVQPEPAPSSSRSRYEVRVAQTGKERNQAFRLRYDVFHREYRRNPIPWGIDRDGFDTSADHLVVLNHAETKTPRVVGTYRMISGKALKPGATFYCESEFNLGTLTTLRSDILELGRLCVRKDFRTGVVMSLLFKGVGAHATNVGARYLLGCSSIFGASQAGIEKVFSRLESEGRVDLSAGVKPLVEGQPKQGSDDPELPPLVGSYFRAGAKVVSPPMYDAFFRCYDFLTLLDLQTLSDRFKRYQR